MNYSKSLTPLEEQETNQLFSENHVNESTRDLCLKLYTEYRSIVPLAADRIPVAIKCAFFIAEKNQVLYDLKVLGLSLRDKESKGLGCR